MNQTIIDANQTLGCIAPFEPSKTVSNIKGNKSNSPFWNDGFYRENAKLAPTKEFQFAQIQPVAFPLSLPLLKSFCTCADCPSNPAMQCPPREGFSNPIHLLFRPHPPCNQSHNQSKNRSRFCYVNEILG